MRSVLLVNELLHTLEAAWAGSCPEAYKQANPLVSRPCLLLGLAGMHSVSFALQVFEEDLAEHPENGFALQGLFRSQEVQTASQATIQETKARLKVAWQHADTPLLAACPALGL